MKYTVRLLLTFLLTFHIVSQNAKAQAPKKLSAGEIQLALKKLNVLGSAMYLAAHPDDENQVVIGYLSQVRLMNTAYLSLNRGSGGQNLIGPEIGVILGVLRTQELLMARSVDGSQQLFTRANDFGYSKSADETLNVWDKDKVLADVVWNIRKFRPDVIITRFPPDERAGHGHHTSSAILGIEAFKIAGNPAYYPEQLKYVEVWQPKRIVFNDIAWFTENIEETAQKSDSVFAIDCGAYLPLLGKSVTEIAAESRSKHLCQGFGSTGTRGSNLEYFRHLAGEMAKDDLFDGVNTSWGQVKGGEKVSELLTQAYENFSPENPSGIVPVLLEAYEAIDKIDDPHWKEVKQKELKKVIQACLGLYLEVRSGTNAVNRGFRSAGRPKEAEYWATPGETITLNVEAVNRSPVHVMLDKVDFGSAAEDTTLHTDLNNNEALLFSTEVKLPENLPNSGPYWLRQPLDENFMYVVEDQQMRGLPQTPPPLQATFSLKINGKPFDFTTPVVYKRNDPDQGEVYRPFEITPPVFLNIAEQVYVFADEQPKTVSVVVRAGMENVKGTLQLALPEGWRTSPASVDFSLDLKGSDQSVSFSVHPPEAQSEGTITATATVNGKIYTKSLTVIAYEHIPTQTVFQAASAKVVKLDIQKRGEMIGYIMGAGDEVPIGLRQIGYHVTMLGENDIYPASLENFDAIILGIRAFNTVDRLRFQRNILMEYVKNGGTLIVQYNTSHLLVTENVGPYPLKLSRDRIADETAKVTFLEPNHPVLNEPNIITQADFSGWVQERGLYFPAEWDEHYEAVLSLTDPGEEDTPKKGSLLVAKYGKGYYIYTGLSFFREIPAGVPGAYRLLTNLISIGKEESAKGH